METAYKKLFTAAWRVSVDARGQVRGKGEELFGNGARWLRSFDFQRPVQGYCQVRGFRFMNEDGRTRMFILKHDGDFMDLPATPDEKFVSTMLKELETAKENPYRICTWYDEYSAMAEENRLNSEEVFDRKHKIIQVCPGIFLKHYNDMSAALVNSSGQRLDTPLHDYDFILDFKYAGKMNGLEHFAYEASSFNGEHVYGLFDVNGKHASFPHINENENRDRLVDAVCESFRKMVREQQASDLKRRIIV